MTPTIDNENSYDGPDRRMGESVVYSGPERRSLRVERGPGKRRSEERRAAEEGEMTAEQFEFIQAVAEYKRINNKPFPSWTEILEIVKALGYRKSAPPADIDRSAES